MNTGQQGAKGVKANKETKPHRLGWPAMPRGAQETRTSESYPGGLPLALWALHMLFLGPNALSLFPLTLTLQASS